MSSPLRILIVYYSRTGNTRKIAAEVAALLHADVDEIQDHDKRSGLFGYLRSGRQAFWRKMVPLQAPKLAPGNYDIVVVGTPIWNVSVSSPVRTYLREHRRELRAVAFFCTCGGMGIDRVFEQMSEESGLSPVAKVAVLESQLVSDGTKRDLAHFARRIQASSISESSRRSA